MGVESQERVLLGPMRESDVSGVCDVERSAHGRPWTKDVFLGELSRDWAHVCVLRKASAPESILGYCNYWIVQDEIHLLNIAVLESERGKGYGRMMVENLLSVARDQQIRCITLEVRESNSPARRLYESVGFSTVRTRHRYYVEDNEDAIVMHLELFQERSELVAS